MIKKIATAVLAAGLVITLAGCNAVEKGIDDIFRVLGQSPGTFINYGADGQVVFQAKCRSMHFERDTTYDVNRWDASDKAYVLVEPSSVVRVSCGDNLLSTVGFTSVYITDGAQDNLAANSQQFHNLKVKNNDRGIPLVNYLWRDVKSLFVGTEQVAQICDQNNNPILAFASKAVTGYSTDVAKSTMFKLDDPNNDGYVWISRGSYTVLDTELLSTVG